MAFKIIVVDDDPLALESLESYLRGAGYDVAAAGSAREALEVARTTRCDVALLDMKMPDANGLELLPTIHKHRPKLPVVMVTGYASIDTAVEAIQRGASDYMAKPFTPDELFATARRAIRRA